MKQFQILTILSLINFNSQAMFRRPAILAQQALATRSISTPSDCYKTCSTGCYGFCKNAHQELETAIAEGQVEEAKRIMRYRWIYLYEPNEAGRTINQFILNSKLPNQTKNELCHHHFSANFHYTEDVCCISARDCHDSLRTCYSDCLGYCEHAHKRLESAIQNGDTEQIKLIMKHRSISLKAKNRNGLTIPELTKQSKHPAVVTLFESYHNNATV